jgi:hypothetical protein
LASLAINDKDCRNERRANNVMKTGDMYSGKVFISSTFFSLKHNLISHGFIYFDTFYAELKILGTISVGYNLVRKYN